MDLTEDMLQAAMKKAVEHGLLPRRQCSELYSQNRATLEDILKTALSANTLKVSSITTTKDKTNRIISSNSPVYGSKGSVAYLHGHINK